MSDSNQDTALEPLTDETIRILVEHHRSFKTFLQRRLGSEADAEDLLQQSFRRAIEAPSRSSDEKGVLAWFYQILRSALIDHYRSRASDERKVNAFGDFLTDEGRDSEPAADEIRAEICACLGKLLTALKPDYRKALEQVDFRGQSVEAVARDLGVSPNTLSVRLHRARNALRLSLERSCGTCTEHGCLNCTCEPGEPV